MFEMCTGTFLSGSGIILKVHKWENKNQKLYWVVATFNKG